MTADSRIVALRVAAQAMLEGDFRPPLPNRHGAPDDVDTLGETLERLGQRLETSFQELKTLAELTEQVNAGYLIEEILDHVFDSFRSIIPYDRIGYAVLEHQGQVARAYWARSLAATKHISVGYTAPVRGSSLQRIIDTGRPRIINDLEQYLRENPGSKSTRLMLKEGIRSSLTCPLVAMSKPVGFLFFSSVNHNAYANAHVDLFMRVARQLSTVVEKGRLFRELLEAKREADRANAELVRLALLDRLTGIANRRAFEERFHADWRRARRDGGPFSVLLIDIDHFKQINDTSGHLAGDECLRALGRELRASAGREGDFVARYGGEEFAVLLPRTDASDAVVVAENIRARVEALEVSVADCDAALRLTVSVGVATTRGVDIASPAKLLAAADRALYAAKDAGRNRVLHASNVCAVEPRSIRTKLKHAERSALR